MLRQISGYATLAAAFSSDCHSAGLSLSSGCGDILLEMFDLRGAGDRHHGG